MSIAHLLSDVIDVSADETAIRDTNGPISFKQWGSDIGHARQQLARWNGLDSLLVCQTNNYDNSIGWLTDYLGALMAGVPVIVFRAEIHPQVLWGAVEAVRPRWLITRSGARWIRTEHSTEGSGSVPAGHWIFTSGTTGSGTPAFCSIADLEALWMAACRHGRRGHRSLAVGVSPGSATFLQGLLPRCLSKGWEMKLANDPGSWRAIWTCDGAVLTERLATFLLSRPIPERRRLRICWLAGEPASRATIGGLVAAGVAVQSMYGQTEVPGYASTAVLSADQPRVIGRIGARMRIDRGESGEILIQRSDGGWARTGDLGRVLADGRVAISGRSSPAEVWSRTGAPVPIRDILELLSEHFPEAEFQLQPGQEGVGYSLHVLGHAKPAEREVRRLLYECLGVAHVPRTVQYKED